MFNMIEKDSKDKGVREKLLNDLIEKLMMMGDDEGESKEMPKEEMAEDGLMKPKADISVMEIEAKPKMKGMNC